MQSRRDSSFKDCIHSSNQLAQTLGWLVMTAISVDLHCRFFVPCDLLQFAWTSIFGNCSSLAFLYLGVPMSFLKMSLSTCTLALFTGNVCILPLRLFYDFCGDGMSNHFLVFLQFFLGCHECYVFFFFVID